ncbi:AAA family ATPase [Streptomyces sp. NPDC101206]|uniref:AAA family ATPase n=1 Tax=Streptomyces sp. NPDC101206 TaxID=3366128 RepID=UPI0038058093
MTDRLLELHVENFRSLRDVTIPLGPLTVLVGPNAAGKSNVLEVFDFLADVIRTDLQPALDSRQGFSEIAFWGGAKPPTTLKIGLKATWTTHASENTPDEYELTVQRRTLKSGADSLSRRESFRFKRTQGRGRRITISGESAQVTDNKAGQEYDSGSFGIQRLSSGLSTLPRLASSDGGKEVSRFAEQLSSFRVFDVDVAAARLPNRVRRGARFLDLSPQADNLAEFLMYLRTEDDLWDALIEDARTVLPQLEEVEFATFGGAADQVTVHLHERGLRRPTPLAYASYGTVRLLGLLALLYDPNPPALTCIEEIDHGLHPQALALIVKRLREASSRSQFLVATHSPSLVDRLLPEEIVVCERDEEGASVIPALTVEEVRAIVEESGDQPLGELWFSGVLGGDLTGGEM